MMHRAELILPALRLRVRRAVPFPPEVVAARFLHDSALRGAIALAIDARPAEHRETLIHRGGGAAP
jgi:glucokinase